MRKLDFPLDKLSDYLAENIPEFERLENYSKFDDGQSNPTFLLETKNKKYVLRAKPPGVLLKSAHAVDREYRVMSALEGTGIAVPKMLYLSPDKNPLERMFFVMEWVEGHIYWNPALSEVSKEKRQNIYASMNETLAALHELNPKTIGLADFGKSGNYFQRQTERWSKQYLASCDIPDPQVLRTIDWLNTNMVQDDGEASLVHGDYRLDNIIFRDDGSVAALLDWELSTLGHPLADLAYQSMQLRMPHNSPLKGLGGLDRSALGIPSEEDYLETYVRYRNLEQIDNWAFYIVFSFFRLTSILQGVQKRAELGNASNSEKALQYGACIPDLVRLMIDALEDA